jgi:hypothetical protein
VVVISEAKKLGINRVGLDKINQHDAYSQMPGFSGWLLYAAAIPVFAQEKPVLPPMCRWRRHRQRQNRRALPGG